MWLHCSFLYPHLQPSQCSHETFSFSALYLSEKARGQELLAHLTRR